MRILDIDAGNTRVKWRYLVDGKSHKAGAFANDSSNALVEMIADSVDGAVDLCRMASVRAPKERESLRASLENVFGVSPALPDPESGIGGVHFPDADPCRLGDDRWLAMLGARKHYPDGPVVVIDSGTALTLDAVDANGVFQGGLITPGVNTMLKSMVDAADLLVLPDEKEFSRSLAKNSVQAVLNGALSMAASLIEREVQRFNSQARVVLCGGDARMLAEQMNIPVEYCPELVFEGLEVAIPVKGMR
ncbi:type III pantothenate kinase [Sansalvadorimonas sp. 2012CJ34-2]|uniref:Type III pantothenate kinase n=1 Tax=Parendozoicomonas callyspongiae TaxID=2942213 RepID=A0ABT0PF57_9GAMM|nr:type III pantothenate kinase [Sansalvadorimonas sp. 2012CJ34-2]MCL6270017.1 type III pantothenate kinase [Sansalvadorimonas sp. 2012CJ34-2]